jgi:signal transduction histidine kinase
MRQPVAGVFALAEAVLAEPGLPGNARARLEQILELTQWLSDMIRQSLGAGDSPPGATRLLDLAGLASEAAAGERVTYPGMLEVLRPAEPVLICGSRVEIRRIIANLLGNATRAAGPLGTVRVEVGYCGQDKAVLVVEDSGPGFGRIKEGPGLGLPAVVRSVGRCAGTIEYGNGSLGGVRVCVSLPMLDGWVHTSFDHATGPV